MRLLSWLGCSIVGGLAVLLSFMNGLPEAPKPKPEPKVSISAKHAAITTETGEKVIETTTNHELISPPAR